MLIGWILVREYWYDCMCLWEKHNALLEHSVQCNKSETHDYVDGWVL
jgi:hypothetical protein